MAGKYQLQFEVDLYPLQQEIVETMDSRKYKFHIAILGRQSGKSFLDKRICLEYSNNRAMRGMWVSPSYTSARTHWNDLLNMLEESKLPVKRLDRQAREIHFHGGGFLAIRSALEPDNMRGESLDYLILDEAGFYRNGRYVWEAVCLPMLTATRGIMLMTTTPNGHNWVYDLYLEGLKEDSTLYKSWHMSALDSPIQDRKLLKQLKKTMTERRWREEILAEFLLDGGGVFAGVGKASTVEMIYAPEAGHTYIAGVDVGGGENDLTAFTVIDKYTREQVFGKAIESYGTINTTKELIRLIDHWNPETTYIERNGVGAHLGSLIKELVRGEVDDDVLLRLKNDSETFNIPEQTGGHRIKLIHMNTSDKVSSVERLAVDIEYGRLSLLDGETTYGKKQQAEFSTFEASRTNSGLSVSYGASAGNHDDTISALYMAYMGVPKPAPFKKHWRNTIGGGNPLKRKSRGLRKHRTGRKNLNA